MNIENVKETGLLRVIGRRSYELKRDDIIALCNDIMDTSKPVNNNSIKELGIKSVMLNDSIIVSCFEEFSFSNDIDPRLFIGYEKNWWQRFVARVRNVLNFGKVAV